MGCGPFCKYETRVDLLHGLFEPSMAHGDPEDDHLRGESLIGKGDTGSVSRFTLHVLTTASAGGLGLNAEHVPNITKCKCERSVLGRCDDDTDPKDGKGCRGLDEDRSDIGIRPGHLWGENLPHTRSHTKETEADHRGDDDVQTHAQRDPRHDSYKLATQEI
jgi:hypothetical protein